MIRAILLALVLAGCGEAARPVPTMAPVDLPAAPRGIAIRCEDPAYEPIRLPTTAADQIKGRQRDREAAAAAIDTCDGRRARAVQYGRRLGAGL